VRLLDEQSGDCPSTGRYTESLERPDTSREFLGQELGLRDRNLKGAYAGDTGGASRFFYTAKAARSERDGGGARNTHPTVKSLSLMTWLCKLVTPPGGIVLDPFAGSGSTLIAALRQGFRAIGIERDPEYAATARARVEEDAPLMRRPRPTLEQRAPDAATDTEPRQMSLLDSTRKDGAK
jgi:site-specific DNA-methyltransferase (adenine-specific)